MLFIGMKPFSNVYLPVNNNTDNKQELNDFSLLNKSISNTVSFGGKRSYRYCSYKTWKIMKAIKCAAVKFGLPDFYTGEIFGKKYKPRIEHLIPYSKSEYVEEAGVKNINSMGNLVPIGDEINHKRDRIPLLTWYEMHPEYIKNGNEALNRYEKIDLKKENYLRILLP